MAYLLPLILIAACRSAPQERKVRIEATASELAPAEKEPGFLCEGTTDLPDGYRLDLYAYFGKPAKGMHIKQTAVLVKEGKFSATFSVFTKKNLAGTYILRITADPNLQPVRFQNLPAHECDVVFKVGTDADAANDRKAFAESLVSRMKDLVAIAEESRLKHVEAKGKLDAAAWNVLLQDWTRRAGRINQDALKEREYQVLGFGPIVNDSFEHLTGIVIDLCRCASRGLEKDLREGRERLDVMVSNLSDLARGTPPDPKKVRIELAENARRFLQDSVYARDDRAPVGRKRFRQAMLDLNKIAPPGTAPVLLEISASATELFDALDEQKDAKPLHEKLDARLGELLKALQNAK